MRRCGKKGGENGLGLFVLILMVLGLGLTAGVLTISARLALEAVALTETQKKMRGIAEVISSTQFQDGALNRRHYEQDVGSLPTAFTDLTTQGAQPACSISGNPQRLTGWCGPYWNGSFQGVDPFVDGWGNALILNTAGRSLRSKGPNGVDDAGGSDDLVQAF